MVYLLATAETGGFVNATHKLLRSSARPVSPVKQLGAGGWLPWARRAG